MKKLAFLFIPPVITLIISLISLCLIAMTRYLGVQIRHTEIIAATSTPKQNGENEKRIKKKLFEY